MSSLGPFRDAHLAKATEDRVLRQSMHSLPLCLTVSLSQVRAYNIEADIEAEASSTGKTRVEMEATTAVSVAGLTVYDMCKAASKSMRITDI